MDNKFKIIKVTVEEKYYVEMHDDRITKINGWTIDEVIKDWFIDYPMGSHHASREGSLIGGSRKYIKSEIVEPEGE